MVVVFIQGYMKKLNGRNAENGGVKLGWVGLEWVGGWRVELQGRNNSRPSFWLHRLPSFERKVTSKVTARG